jgi:hypothetical protein
MTPNRHLPPVLSFEQRFQRLDICSLQEIGVETSGEAYFAHDFIAVCRKGDQVRSRGRRCLAKPTCQVEPVMSCNERSRIAQSGWKILAIERAVRPSAAAATSCPINSTKRTMSRLTSSLSSTTRTFRNRWATAFVGSVQNRWVFPKTDYVPCFVRAWMVAGSLKGSHDADLCALRGTRTRKAVPQSRFDSSLTVPFISRTRSSILRRPRPG